MKKVTLKGVHAAVSSRQLVKEAAITMGSIKDLKKGTMFNMPIVFDKKVKPGYLEVRDAKGITRETYNISHGVLDPWNEKSND